MYDRTTKNCKLFSSSPIDLWTDCEEVGYAREPNFDQCHVVFPADSPNACYVSILDKVIKVSATTISSTYYGQEK